MQNILAKVDTFPNRIASIQQSALFRTGNNLNSKLSRKFPPAYYLNYEISISGKLGYRLTITPERGARTSTGSDSFIAATVFLRGRKSYMVYPRKGSALRLREGNPEFIKYARIPKMKGHSEDIKREAREEIIKNLEYAIKRYGFGPRGGSAGLEDLPRIRGRA